MDVPKLRFKNGDDSYFPEWQKSNLGDISKKYYQGINTTADNVNYTDSGVPIIQAKHITDEFLNFSDVRYLGRDDYQTYKEKFNPKVNELLVSNIGTLGKVVLVENEKDFLIAWNIFKITLDESQCFPLYVSNYLKKIANEGYFDSIKTGNATKFINKADMLAIPVRLPSLSEQIKIADFLTAMDEKITQLTQKYELLNQYKKGVMQKIFSQELRFKDGDGIDFPEWSTFTISEVLIKNSNKNKNLEFNLVQSVSNKHGFINQDELFEDRVIASKDLSNYYIIKQRAFAYNPSRLDVGSLAYKRDDRISVVSPLYVSFYAKSDFIFDEFLINWFDNNEFKKQMTNSFEGGVRNTLSYDSLSKMTISLPNLKEQTKIANFLTAIDDKIKTSQSQLELVKQYKQGLLQQMFV